MRLQSADPVLTPETDRICFSTHNPAHKMGCLVRLALRLAVPACVVSCCKTHSRSALTAAV